MLRRDSINIGSAVGSYICRMDGSLAGPAVSEQGAELCASNGATIAGNVRYNFII